MKRILTVCMLAAISVIAANCGNKEDNTGNNSDSTLNSPPPASPDNTTTPGNLSDSTRRDSINMDTTMLRH